ncbi:MAG: glycosyltransferase family 9 protein [Elusimicrobiaceae bacterium]|nr:glycosyltransferase family 9 protein [Elusimicrobiaceae bacterium]
MEAPKKILLCLVGDKVGDSIVASFMPRELKKLFPQVQVTVMSTASPDLWQHNPHVDQILAIPYGKGRWKKIFQLLPQLRKEHYDLLIATGHSLKRKICFYLIRAKQTICVDSCAPQQVHYSQRFEGVFRRLGATHIDSRYELHMPDTDKQAVFSFMQTQHLVGGRFLVFNPIGADAFRCLSIPKISEICTSLQQVLPADFPIVLLDYKHQYDCLQNQCILYRGNSLLRTAALIEQAGYVLTVDTGIAHIADAFEKQMTVLFSLQPFPTAEAARAHLGRWTPRTAGTGVVCTRQQMNDINSQYIVNGVQNLISKR